MTARPNRVIARLGANCEMRYISDTLQGVGVDIMYGEPQYAVVLTWKPGGLEAWVRLMYARDLYGGA